MTGLVRDRRYLITGGTGFLGRELIKQLCLSGFTNLVVVARNEGKLIALKSEYPAITIIPGDIADENVAIKACNNVDGIFHLAAFKHVGLAEDNVFECSKSNIVGTNNLLKASYYSNIDFFVFISTDKAAQVNGVYGATKFICERLISDFQLMYPSTKYITIRYGNVWGSTGSIGTKWKHLMKAGKDVIITDPAATRFFFSVKDAVTLILSNLTNRGLIIPQMKAVSMITAFEACQEVYGKSAYCRIGLQPGENMHETLDGKVFSNEVPQYTKEEFIKVFLND